MKVNELLVIDWWSRRIPNNLNPYCWHLFAATNACSSKRRRYAFLCRLVPSRPISNTTQSNCGRKRLHEPLALQVRKIKLSIFKYIFPILTLASIQSQRRRFLNLEIIKIRNRKWNFSVNSSPLQSLGCLMSRDYKEYFFSGLRKSSNGRERYKKLLKLGSSAH